MGHWCLRALRLSWRNARRDEGTRTRSVNVAMIRSSSRPQTRAPRPVVQALVITLVMLSVLGLCSMCDAAVDGAAADNASCSHPSPFDTAPGVGGPEVIGSGSGAQLWGLVMARQFPLVASRAVVKIVWRMTGKGSLKQVGYSHHGKSLQLAWGPEIHGGSNYARPGIEWGAGYRFTTPGCYRLTARRARGSAVVWLRIK